MPTPLELSLELDTAQDNAWRSAFKLQCCEFASGTLFNPITESHELGLTLVRLGPCQAFQMIHGECRDRARYLPLAVNHRKEHEAAVEHIGSHSGRLPLTQIRRQAPPPRTRSQGTSPKVHKDVPQLIHQ